MKSKFQQITLTITNTANIMNNTKTKSPNDIIREKIKAKGISVNNVSLAQLELLHKELSISLEKSGNYDGTYRMNPLDDYRYMTCRTNQWESREAVSFNRDGFIGFCGWADSKNTKPILDGVLNWLEKI